MNIVLLALDGARAPHTVSKLAAVLGPDRPFSVVSPTSLDAPGVVLNPEPRPYSPDESLRAIDRIRRTAALAGANRRNFTGLRASASAMALLADADLVVVGDDVSVRAGRFVAHSLGRRVWGRISTVGYILGVLERS